MPPPVQPTAILDYAGPRPRGKLRLPARSVLEVERDRDGLTVTQTLRGKGTAYLAMAGGLFCTVVPPVVAVAQMSNPSTVLSRLLAGRFQSDELVGLCIALVLSAAEATVLVLVANNTWRKTLLRARDGEINLLFTGLFHRREYRWPFERLLEVGVDRTMEPGFLDPRVELVLRAHGGEHVHLFAVHPEVKLESIVAGLRETMARGGRMTR
jgi:hypothetical protein